MIISPLISLPDVMGRAPKFYLYLPPRLRPPYKLHYLLPSNQIPSSYTFSCTDYLPLFPLLLLPAATKIYVENLKNNQEKEEENRLNFVTKYSATYVGNYRSWCSGRMAEAEAVAFLLLPLACFVVLEPVKHILALYLAVLAKLSCYLFYLLCIRSAHASPIQHF